jgi:hypothetical protein
MMLSVRSQLSPLSLSSKGLAHPVVGVRWTLNMRLGPNSNPPNRHFSWDSTVWVKFQRHA